MELHNFLPILQTNKLTMCKNYIVQYAICVIRCRCPACTFENEPRSSICEVCGTMLKAASAERLPNGDAAAAAASAGALPLRPPHRLPPIRPMSTMAASGKQESELMDQLREVRKF